MAAGLGFKDFTTGEVLTAADVDGYLMQGVWVFASAAARDAAVTSPQEGNFAFLKDTNTTTYYTGSAWTNLDTTGMVNPMTTTGDTIYSSSGSTPARLGIGSTGQVLTVSGGVPTWATPAGGGKVLQVVSTTYSTTTTISTTTFTDSGLSLAITPSANTSKVLVLLTQSFQHDKASGNQVDSATILLRNSTQVYAPYSGNATIYRKTGGATNQDHQELITMAYLDSPATTSSVTYKTQGQCATGCTLRYQFNSIPSTITLLEIGA
jgi:hypothetical protein